VGGAAEQPGKGPEGQRHHGGDGGPDLAQHICKGTEHVFPFRPPAAYDPERPGSAGDTRVPRLAQAMQSAAVG
jgi:hypothetical protein